MVDIHYLVKPSQLHDFSDARVGSNKKKSKEVILYDKTNGFFCKSEVNNPLYIADEREGVKIWKIHSRKWGKKKTGHTEISIGSSFKGTETKGEGTFGRTVGRT